MPSDAALIAEIDRRLRVREAKCVLVDAEDKMTYAAWIEFAALWAGTSIDCLTAYNPAASADAIAVPPPPPPAMGEPEEPAAQGKTPPPPPVKPVHPGLARVEHWWKATSDKKNRAGAAVCKERLGRAKATFDAEEPKTSASMVVLATLEEECGDAVRATALKRMRTESFPEDRGAWLALGVAEFDVLFPDPESGKAFREDLDDATRFAAATRAIAAFEAGLERAPKERDLHVWASMAYTQRKHAANGAKPIDPDLHARVDAMKAWKHTQAVCEIDGTPPCADPPATLCCPPAPQTDPEHTADLAALAR